MKKVEALKLWTGTKGNDNKQRKISFYFLHQYF